MNKDIWDILYQKALETIKPQKISPTVEIGSVASAILTKSGNIYTGICVDTASTLGVCAERNAIFNMLTNGETKIDKVVAVVDGSGCGAPCGACRELMMQLDKNSGDIEILLDYDTKKTIRLKELLPYWWAENLDMN